MASLDETNYAGMKKNAALYTCIYFLLTFVSDERDGNNILSYRSMTPTIIECC